MKELIAALIAAQQEFPPAVKDSTNPFFNSSYLSLEGAWDMVKGPLWKHGLTVAQYGELDESGASLVTEILHTSGQTLKGRTPVVSAKQQDPQAFGAAMTYARRYGLLAMVGLCPEDDDGNQAAGRTEVAKPAPAKAPSRPAAPAPSANADDQVTVVDVESKPGKAKSGKVYTLYKVTFSDGVEATTFNEKVGTLAGITKVSKSPVLYSTEQSGKYLNLTALTIAPEPSFKGEDEDDLPF